MATYKQPCMHCGQMIERDAHLCPVCGSRSPFGYHCPQCLKPIAKGQLVCSACGRPLYTLCPVCTHQTFVADTCEFCGTNLMVLCSNKRCGEPQFFENTICTVCGKKLKKRK